MAAVADHDRRDHDHDHLDRDRDEDRELKRGVRELVDLLSKLNPSAKEFVPSSKSAPKSKPAAKLSPHAPVFSPDQYNSNLIAGFNYYFKGFFGVDGPGNLNQHPHPHNRRRRNGFNQGRRRFNERVQKVQKEDCIRRTVYVSDIDVNVTEEQLAALFNTCGQVLDCRVCGDPNSVLRFAFIEFADEYCARAALSLGGTMLGFYPLRVLPSKTAILPVNPTFLPQSRDEREMCSRTVYCTNIDKKVTQQELKDFFDYHCGEVSRLRLLGDQVHSTRIAFVEFFQADSAILALNCCGLFLRSLPLRVSPSKTPVRSSRAPRASLQ